MPMGQVSFVACRHCGGFFQWKTVRQPERERRQRETANHVNEVMIAEVDRRAPQAHTGNEIEPESPRTMTPIEEQKETGDRAVETGEHIHPVAALRHDRRVPFCDRCCPAPRSPRSIL